MLLAGRQLLVTHVNYRMPHKEWPEAISLCERLDDIHVREVVLHNGVGEFGGPLCRSLRRTGSLGEWVWESFTNARELLVCIGLVEVAEPGLP